MKNYNFKEEEIKLKKELIKIYNLLIKQIYDEKYIRILRTDIFVDFWFKEENSNEELNKLFFENLKSNFKTKNFDLIWNKKIKINEKKKQIEVNNFIWQTAYFGKISKNYGIIYRLY